MGGIVFERLKQGWRNARAKGVVRQVVALTLIGAAVGCIPRFAHAAGPTSPGTSWIVMDVASGKIIAEHAPYTLRYPASLTKLMTLDLAFDALAHGRMSMHTPLPVSSVAADVPPVKLDLRAGQTISVRNAMLGMTTLSANDAATALGQYLGHGSMRRFARAATREAHALGMLKTRFTNSSGLPDPREVTDAYDMALLARHILLTYPQYRYLFAVKQCHIKGRLIRNIDGMLSRYRGTIGMKTGFTDLARFNLVTAAKRNGHLLVGVELHARSWRASYDRMALLLNQGFAHVPQTVVAATNSPGSHSPAPAPAPDTARIHEVAQEIDSGHSVTQPPVAGWAAQVGSYDTYADARRQASHIHRMRGIGVIRVDSIVVHGRRLWRAELAGLDQGGARYTCRMMKRYHESCFTIRPQHDGLASDPSHSTQATVHDVASHQAARIHEAVAQAGAGDGVVQAVIPGWAAQVGAYDKYADAKHQAQHIHHMRGIGVPHVLVTNVHHHRLWLAELSGLDRAGARYTCRMMKRYHESCMVQEPADLTTPLVSQTSAKTSVNSG